METQDAQMNIEQLRKRLSDLDNPYSGRKVIEDPADIAGVVICFEQYPYGQAALKKMGEVTENFRLYEAGFMEERPEDFDTMAIKGAEFRPAKSGPNKGKLTVMVPGTQRTVYVTKAEIQACAAKLTGKE